MTNQNQLYTGFTLDMDEECYRCKFGVYWGSASQKFVLFMFWFLPLFLFACGVDVADETFIAMNAYTIISLLSAMIFYPIIIVGVLTETRFN